MTIQHTFHHSYMETWVVPPTCWDLARFVSTNLVGLFSAKDFILTSKKHFLLALLQCSSLLRCFQNLGSHDNTVTQKQGVVKLSRWLALPHSPLMTFCHTLTIPTVLPTWLGPVVEARVAVVVVAEGTERLWAEHTVTLQILAHVLQEPQHRRRAGGSRQLHVADAVFGTHCKTKHQRASGCVQRVKIHKHTEYTFTARDKEQMVRGWAPSPFQVHIFHPISHCCTLPSHPSQACTNPQINTPPHLTHPQL